ncbi:MAG: hypothetical protein CME26_09155 [Gemmatimonadetes bacterium]|nr:hypothetical protein [Gemmatimonadota bacterium]
MKTSPVIAGGRVYVGDVNKQLYALE